MQVRRRQSLTPEKTELQIKEKQSVWLLHESAMNCVHTVIMNTDLTV